MNAVSVFDEYAQEYDRWFDENQRVYQSEVDALRRFIPLMGVGIEIGVGTGRFAVPCGIKIGIDPSEPMAQIAKSRGMAVCRAVGERLPFRNDQFDFVLLVTVICFVEDPSTLLREARRVLKPGGRIIIGFIDRNSTLGQLYESRKDSDKFYRHARFYSVAEVAERARQAGFVALQFCQTIFGIPGETTETEEIRDGFGEGAFVVLSAERKGEKNNGR
ncbi:MAG: methyltransferase domain-containing protein [Chloroflexota bacterium]